MAVEPTFHVREATEADGAGLLRLLSPPAGGGGVRWTVERTADFFVPFRAEEGAWQVLVAEETGTGRLAGCLTVVAREAHLNGQVRTTCYVSNFIVRKDARGRGVGDALCWRAAEFCSAVAGDDGPVLLAIRRGNSHMRRLIRGPRGLPAFRSFARFSIYSIPTMRVRGVGDVGRVGVRAADPSDLEEMAALADRVFRVRQFAPAVDRGRLGRALATGIALPRAPYSADYLVAQENGALLGWLGLLDEAAIRRVRVAGYTPLAALRYAARDRLRLFTGAPRVPRVGDVVGCTHVWRACVPSARPDVLRALLVHASERLAESACAWLKIALDDRDPLAAALARMTVRASRFDALVVTPMGAYAGPTLDNRPLHFEAALT